MGRISPIAKRFPPILFQSIAFGLLIATVVLAGLPPGKALADVPNFPSPTPTITPTRTATTTLERTPLPAATSTTLPTLTPLAFVSGQDQNPPALAPTVQPIPPEPGGGIGCWPFALLLVLAVILGITYYFTRRAHPEEEYLA